MNENWKPVIGFEESHSVSSLGRIRVEKNGRITVGARQTHGYCSFEFRHNGKIKREYVHRVVAAAFIGECPSGYCVDHIDGNRSNNNVNNLRYVTQKGNAYATIERGANVFGSRVGTSKLNEAQVVEIIFARKGKEGTDWGFRELAKKFGVCVTQVRVAAYGRTFKHVHEAIANGEWRKFVKEGV